jgi:hypothetical protein
VSLENKKKRRVKKCCVMPENYLAAGTYTEENCIAK